MTRHANPHLDTVVADLCRMTRSLAGDYQDPGVPRPVREDEIASGRLLEDVLAGVHMVPYLHALGEFSDVQDYRRIVRGALKERRKATGTDRDRLDALLRQTRGILELYPPEIDGPVAEVRAMMDMAGVHSAWHDQKTNRPDIREEFKYGEYLRPHRGYRVKWAKGLLGCPGKVRNWGKTLSATNGDHYGHMIAGQFGATGDLRNLTYQNRLQNRGGGTYYRLETAWKEELLTGSGVHVIIRAYLPLDVYGPAGTDRPSYREVEWTIVRPDGTRWRPHADVYFANTHTQLSRSRLGEP